MSLKQIGYRQFEGTKFASNDITLPEGITTISTLCFDETNISQFVVPLSTEIIKDLAFSSCTSLVKFIIPANCALNDLGYKLFAGCTNLFVIESNISEFVVENSALYDGERTTLFAFPPASPTKYFAFAESVRSISPGAFIDCINLEIILIPDNSIETIGFSAFEGCRSLHTINIPKSVTTIGNSAFYGCNKLHCGLSIEERNIEILKKWINEALLPKYSVLKCEKVTCKRYVVMKEIKLRICCFVLFML